MRVLYVSPLPPPPGGIATWTYEIKRNLELKNVSFDIINTAVSRRRVRKVEVFRLSDELIRNTKIITKFIIAINRKKYDILHINSSLAPLGVLRDYLVVKISNLFSLKIVVHFHCDVGYMIRKGNTYSYFTRICDLAHRVICLNKESLTICKEFNTNCSILPNFIDSSVLDLGFLKQINDTISQVLFVGHVELLKGCDLIINTAKLFPNIKFKLVGLVNEEIHSIETPANVELAGVFSKQQVYEEMIKSDVFLFPSLTEGFPLVILEAMAIGLPIIATPVGSLPEILDSSSCRFVDFDSLNDIENALRFLDSKSIREGMSISARNKVNKYYTNEVILDELKEIYEGLIYEFFRNN